MPKFPTSQFKETEAPAKLYSGCVQGLKNLQESATYKRTSENIQFAKVLMTVN
jgi:hypothetical protein